MRNCIGSTFRTSPESHLFPTCLMLLPWSELPSSLAWILAVALWQAYFLQHCSPHPSYVQSSRVSLYNRSQVMLLMYSKRCNSPDFTHSKSLKFPTRFCIICPPLSPTCYFYSTIFNLPTYKLPWMNLLLLQVYYISGVKSTYDSLNGKSGRGTGIASLPSSLALFSKICKCYMTAKCWKVGISVKQKGSQSSMGNLTDFNKSKTILSTNIEWWDATTKNAMSEWRGGDPIWCR